MMEPLERKLWWICATIVALIYGVAGFVIGQQWGRAKQKKVDEAECATQPVVKKVPPTFTFDTATGGYECVVQDPTHLLCDERKFQKLAVPATQPSKEKRKPMDMRSEQQ